MARLILQGCESGPDALVDVMCRRCGFVSTFGFEKLNALPEDFRMDCPLCGCSLKEPVQADQRFRSQHGHRRPRE